MSVTRHETALSRSFPRKKAGLRSGVIAPPTLQVKSYVLACLTIVVRSTDVLEQALRDVVSGLV